MVTRAGGFTLAEVIVAMTLLSAAALGVAATALLAVQSLARVELQQAVLREAEAVLDSLLVLPVHAAGSRQVHNSTISWTAADSTGAFSVAVRSPHRGMLHLAGQR